MVIAGILPKNITYQKINLEKAGLKRSHREDWTWGKAPISSSNPSDHFFLQLGIIADGRVGERLKRQ